MHQLRLTWAIGSLLAFVSIAGIFWPAVYASESHFVRPLMIAQDWFDLVVVLPLVISAGWRSRRTPWRMALVWLGTLAYLVYSFAVYAFSIHHNPLFLAYVALFSLSTYGLVAGSLAFPRDLFAQASKSMPARRIGVYLMVVGSLFSLIWLADILGSLLAGRIPAVVERFQTPTFAVYVLDLGFALPALVLSGWQLRARRPAGFVVGGLMLVMLILMMLQLAWGSLYSGMNGGQVEWGFLGLFSAIGLASIGVVTCFFLSCGDACDHSPPPAMPSETVDLPR